MSTELWMTTSACRCELKQSCQRKTATPDHMLPVGAGGGPGSCRPLLAKDEIDMPSVHDASDVPPPLCPICGNPAELISVRREPGTHTLTGDYACRNAHPWTTRWMEVA